MVFTTATIIFDIIMLAIVVTMVILGYNSGFLRMVFGVLAIVVAFVFGGMFMPYISGWLEDTNLGRKVNTKVYTVIAEKFDEVSDDLTVSEKMKVAGIPDSVSSYVQENITSQETNVVKSVSEAISSMVIKAISLGIVGGIVLVMFLIACFFLSILRDLPIVGNLDSLWGCITGLVFGLCLVIIICAVVFIFSVYNDANWLQEVSAHSISMSFMDKINFMSLFSSGSVSPY